MHRQSRLLLQWQASCTQILHELHDMWRPQACFAQHRFLCKRMLRYIIAHQSSLIEYKQMVSQTGNVIHVM